MTERKRPHQPIADDRSFPHVNRRRRRMRDASEAIRRMLERLQAQSAFPERPVIKRFTVYADNDSTGDPAYYIAVLVDNDTPERDLTSEKVRPIEDLIFDKVFRGPDERWPYVRVVREQDYFAPVEEW